MLKSVFKSKNTYFGVKTFTYFIPAPPARKTGYQEKEFDSIISNLMKMGFEIVSVNTSSFANDKRCGMWVVCVLGARTKEVFDKEVLFDSTEGLPLDPDIIHE